MEAIAAPIEIEAAKALGLREKRFSAEHHAEAEIFKQQQQRLWNKLLEQLPTATNFVQQIRSRISNNLSVFRQRRRAGSKFSASRYEW
jgi:Mlc titration factor MtfA (ptsG expression regulator)